MDCLWSAATSLAELQTFQRPAVRGQSSRHRRSLFVTAKSGAGAQCRREKPDTSPRPRTACLADDARHSGTPDPFLCPPRHNLPKQIDAHVPHSLDVHIIMDNYATHKTALIRSWLA